MAVSIVSNKQLLEEAQKKKPEQLDNLKAKLVKKIPVLWAGRSCGGPSTRVWLLMLLNAAWFHLT